LISRINKISQSIQEGRADEQLHVIAADKDWLVPMDAVLSSPNQNKQLIVKNRSHLSVLYADETEQKIIEWLIT